MAETTVKVAWSPAFARVLLTRSNNIGDNGNEAHLDNSVKSDKLESVIDQWLHPCPQGQLAHHLEAELTRRQIKPQRIEIAASVTRRILHTRLAQSVAQLTTAGFTDWLQIRQNLASSEFHHRTRRGEGIGHEDLIFPIEERMSATGEVVTPLNVKQAEKQLDRLKEKGVSKIAIHFLHAHRNSLHLRQMKELAIDKGFEVFAHPRSPESRDEQSAWRRNLLDAGLFSFFEKSEK